MERLYYDSHDTRPRHSRRSDLSREETSSHPTTYAGYHTRNAHNSNITNAATSRSTTDDDRYDHRYNLRYHYPPASSADHSRRPQRSPLRKRRSWPPQPFAEDERTSLRRESNAKQLLKNAGREDEVPSRGTPDQDPVILDVPELMNQYERRFVLASNQKRPDTQSIPTPPTSEDEKARKARRKPSKLTINQSGRDPVPEAATRTSSPYAYTRPTKLAKEASSSDRFSSGDSFTPPSSAARKKVAAYAPLATPSSPRWDSGRHSPNTKRGKDYFSASSGGDESAIDDTGYMPKQVSTRDKKLTDRPLTESPRVAAVDFASKDSVPIRKLNLDARRNTDSQESLPTLGRLNIDKSRRPTPLVASTSLSEARDAAPIPSSSLDPRSASAYPKSRDSSYASSRPVSPAGSNAGSIGQGGVSPSRSPRMSAEFSQPNSAQGSRPPSVSSVSNSRPPSPSPRTPLDSPRLAKTDMDWSTLIAANAARRPKQPSRLAESTVSSPHPNDMRRSLAPAAYPAPTSALPYPEDSSLMGSTVLMPEEMDHAYQPDRQPAKRPTYPYESQSSTGSSSPAVPPNEPSSGSSSRTTRPVMTRGYSASAPVEQRSEKRPLVPELKRTESYATTSEARKEIASLMKKGLPPCSRPDYVTGYDDWYTINGATNIDFCPDCIDTLFERTVYRPHFRRSLPRSLDSKVRCAFGSPWMRLAWLLTLQQHRTDLSLLKDVAEIEETTEPCPGNVQTVQSWYGLRDPDGLFVRDFHVCFGDVRKIERLLPSLAGLHVRLPQRASYEKRACAMRTDSNRFSAYLDALVSTHEKAHASRKGADPMPLIDLIERKTRLRECTRDNMLIGGLWHFIADIPTLTVCEDCFESVVEPEIKNGSSVAKKFNRTVQPVYGEGLGSSCQLYSKRMRKVLQRAVDDSDLKYLSRKSKERREAELYLQDRYKDVMKKAKRLAQSGDVDEEDERRLSRELEKISSEWKTKWE